MIIRGTTPSLSFHITSELDLAEIAEVWITFKNKYGEIKEKTFTHEDVTIDAENNNINLFMTQEDTLEFSDYPQNVQIRLRMNDGLAYASSILEEPIGKILKDGII